MATVIESGPALPRMGDGMPVEFAQIVPRLRAHATWHQHDYRNNAWYLLHDDALDKQYYLSETAYRLVVQFDGRRSVAQIIDASTHENPPAAQIVEILLRLQMADLIVLAGQPPDIDRLYQRWTREHKQGWLAPLLRPLSVRVRLFDPQHILASLTPACARLFSFKALLIWLMIILTALIVGAQQAEQLHLHATTRFLDPVNLILIWVTYPIVKGLHEFGHAIAIKHWGGRVREMGIMLLVFVPVPYVQASSASLFVNKHHRVVVGAAGIIVELFLAALALFVFTLVQPGLIRDIAFNVSILAGVASLFFNANPLLRFDGYYVLGDSIEIPNLATRSRQYYVYLLQRYAYGVADSVSPVIAQGERGWFLFYGLASTLYRVGVSIIIAFFVASKLFFVGVILAVWVLTSQWLLPIVKGIHHVFRSEQLTEHRRRAVTVTVTAIVVLIAVVSVLPLPSATVAEGVILVPRAAIVRARASGEIVEVMQQTNQHVSADQPLLRLHDAQLMTHARVLKAEQVELQAKLESQLFGDRVESAIVQEQLATVEAEIKEVQQRVNDLTVKAGVSGRLHLNRAQDLAGRFTQKGQVLGVVATDQLLTARVVVPQAEAERVRNDTRATQARFAGAMHSAFAVTLQSEVPSGTNTLPSASLGSPHGGRIGIDPRDERGLTALSPVFQFDIALPTHTRAMRAGRRVLVRFTHSPETLASRWYRSIRALLLDRFEV